MPKSLLTLNDITPDQFNEILKRIKKHKTDIKSGKEINVLRNKVVGLLFEKQSTRTRAGFESAVLRLGGKAIYMSSQQTQMGRGEPVKDVARILGGYFDCLVARVYAQSTVQGLAEFSGIPIINGLSDLAHPTQGICDIFTISEFYNELKGLKLTYVGDGNNVCHSLLLACSMVGMDISVGCPDNYKPNKDFVLKAIENGKKSGSKVEIVSSPKEASKNADVLYADTWVSMGEDDKKQQKIKDFQGYQINNDLLKVAKKDAKVMHCLPAYRGMEITDEALEGPQSIAWQQGENKMHSATGILDFFING